MWVVNLSVYQTMAVLGKKHVFKINAKTLVQVPAESMLIVEHLTTTQLALVMMDIQEIHYLHVMKSPKHLVREYFNFFSKAVSFFF